MDSLEQRKWVKTCDIVKGDIIRFKEIVCSRCKAKSWKQNRRLGERTIIGKVHGEHYGAISKPHTFVLEVISCHVSNPNVPQIQIGIEMIRTGSEIYGEDTCRMLWDDEAERDLVAEEKHERGKEARRMRYG